MKTNEIKKGIAKEFKIPLKDIRLKNSDGWIHLYIRDTLKNNYNFKDFRESQDFLDKIEVYILNNTNCYTFIADDGYDTQRFCINSSWDNFEYL